jgi:acyl carrier protein
MDREEHGRQSGAFRHAREIMERTYGTQPRFSQSRVLGEQIRMTPEAQQMIEHIVRLIRKPGLTIDENTPLVSSGLIDSMALVDLLLKLEDLTHMRIPPGKVQPKDLETVAMMFATAQRVGKPRK